MKSFGTYPDEFMLMRGFTSGERAAFTSVYNEYYFRVYLYTSRFLPTGADAEDIAADAFIKLWQRHSEFGDLQHIQKFLFLTARNACLNFLQHTRMKTQKHAEIYRTLSQSQRESFYLEEIQSDLMQRVYAEVEKLPVRMKEIFLLSYREGLKPAEIAERLQLSVQTVSNQKSSALSLLKTALGDNPLLLALLLSLDSMALGTPPWTA